MKKLRWLALGVVAVMAGCFPIELDSKDGKLLIARQEGFFTVDPASGKVQKVYGVEDGKPVFARFSPDGKEVLAVSEVKNDFQTYRFVVTPAGGGGKAREVYKASRTAYVSYSPDGTTLAVARIADKQDPEMKQEMPELHLVNVKEATSKMIASKVGVLYRWFADSKRILVLEIQKMDEERNFLANLAILDVASGKSKPIAAVLAKPQSYLALSPDNKKVLVTALAADKAGAKVEKPKDAFSMKLFEVDVGNGAVRKIDKEAKYAVYSPSGKQILLGLPPEGFSFTGVKLEVADAALAKFATVTNDAHMPISLGGEGMMFPGWVDEKTIYYFQERLVFGTAGKSTVLVTIGVDGKGKKSVQPQIDAEAMKEGL